MVADIVAATDTMFVPNGESLFSPRPMSIPVAQQAIFSVVFLVVLFKAYAKMLSGNQRHNISLATNIRHFETQSTSPFPKLSKILAAGTSPLTP